MVKNPPANKGDEDSAPGSQEDPLEQEMATQSSILAWKITWSLESYSSWSPKELDIAEQLSMHTAILHL